MKGIFTERNFVVVLFIMVLVAFSFAQRQTKEIEHLYNGNQSLRNFPALKPEAKAQATPNSSIAVLKPI